jgi:hypothetical protein
VTQTLNTRKNDALNESLISNSIEEIQRREEEMLQTMRENASYDKDIFDEEMEMLIERKEILVMQEKDFQDKRVEYDEKMRREVEEVQDREEENIRIREWIVKEQDRLRDMLGEGKRMLREKEYELIEEEHRLEEEERRFREEVSKERMLATMR